MKRILLFALFVLLIILMSCDQQDVTKTEDPPLVQYDRTQIFASSLGSNVSDLVTGSRQTIDGGVVVCGYTIASAFGDNDIFVTKLDDSSNIVWSKIIGGAGNDIAVYMDTTYDGGFIICGSSNSFSSTFDPVAIKIDNSGNIVWAKQYFWWNDDRGAYIVPTADYGYIITGASNSFGAGGYDAYVLKVDAGGNIMWCRAYGGPLDDFGAAVRNTPDGGYVLAGNTASFGSGGEIIVLKLFGDGGLSWSKTYGSLGADNARDLITVSGGFVICGSTTSFGVSIEDGYIISLDHNGNLYWSRSFGGLLGEDDRFLSMKSIPGGGIIISGSMKNTGGNGEDYCLLRLYSDGVFNWMKSFGGVGTDISTAVANKNDGSFLLGGFSASYGAGANDAYIVSLKSDGKGCLQENNVTPNGGDPVTEIGLPQVTYNDVNFYQTNNAGFNTADFTVTKNTQCLSSP